MDDALFDFVYDLNVRSVIAASQAAIPHFEKRGGGNIINGTVFVNTPGGGGYRAVTVLGAIGRVRGYRWNGTDWTRS